MNYKRVLFCILGVDDDILGPEGMEKFCEDIGVEPENVSRYPSFICKLYLSITLAPVE